MNRSARSTLRLKGSEVNYIGVCPFFSVSSISSSVVAGVAFHECLLAATAWLGHQDFFGRSPGQRVSARYASLSWVSSGHSTPLSAQSTWLHQERSW